VCPGCGPGETCPLCECPPPPPMCDPTTDPNCCVCPECMPGQDCPPCPCQPPPPMCDPNDPTCASPGQGGGGMARSRSATGLPALRY
jgi:hypothetical protein